MRTQVTVHHVSTTIIIFITPVIRNMITVSKNYSDKAFMSVLLDSSTDISSKCQREKKGNISINQDFFNPTNRDIL